jgi:hypothetical protein
MSNARMPPPSALLTLARLLSERMNLHGHMQVSAVERTHEPACAYTGMCCSCHTTVVHCCCEVTLLMRTLQHEPVRHGGP